MNTKTFYQAVLMGVSAVLLGLVLSILFGSLRPELAKECEIWDKYYVMEVTLFFIGVILRLILELDMGKKYLLAQ